jgi:putative hydrolase of HD superfamily
MLSIHDLVEIEAGDTFLFDEAAMVGSLKEKSFCTEDLRNSG